jgi:hypothetical protein
MLPVCNGQETNPCISILSTSTGYQQSGTGSSVTGGYILNDGEYMTLSGTNNTFNINYQVGKGTSTITAITKNSVYTYSNGATSDSTQDPSMQQIVTVGYKSSGLTSIVGNIEREVQGVKEETKSINAELDRLDGLLFTQTADKTVGNTTTETSLFDGGVGSLVIPKNTLKVGDTVRMRLMGYVSGTNGDASTIKVKLGASELVSSTSNFPATVTGVFVEFLYEFTIRSIGSAGTVMGQGRTMFNASVGFGTSTVRGLQMTSGAVAIDTTKDNLVDITYTWGTARVENTITITNATVEIKKQ